LLGAGFCAPAGLPLGAKLFDGSVVAHSKRAARDVQRTLSAWEAWRAKHPGDAAEEFISRVYESDSLESAALWPSLVRFLGYRLAQPFATFGRYDGKTSRWRDNIFEARLCVAHEVWWDSILRFAMPAERLTVMTTNWDIWVERALRPRAMQRPYRPGFNYGYGAERLAATTAYPRSAWRKDPQVSGSVPVLKLHGSLNWAVENNELVRYGDLRPAFRGDAAIVPPTKRKATPRWLSDIWRQAAVALTTADKLVMVGYSLPEYDEEVYRLLREGLCERLPPVHVFDPNVDKVVRRLTRLLPGVSVISHPGLPEGLSEIASVFA